MVRLSLRTPPGVGMRNELTILYGDVVAGEVSTVEEFRLRLADIEALEGAEDDIELRPAAAIRAFQRLESDSPSRHHQLEILHEALGLG